MSVYLEENSIRIHS